MSTVKTDRVSGNHLPIPEIDGMNIRESLLAQTAGQVNFTLTKFNKDSSLITFVDGVEVDATFITDNVVKLAAGVSVGQRVDFYNVGDAIIRSEFGAVKSSILTRTDSLSQMYTDLGYIKISSPYGAGVSFSSRMQFIEVNNEFWRVSETTSIPYTTTGAGMPESGAFVGAFIGTGGTGGTVTDDTIRQDLSSFDVALGSSLIGYKPSFVGSQGITQYNKNRQVCHINDFPSTPENTWLSRAIDGTPDGWTLQLGAGTYTGKFSKTRSNIRIVGASKPRPNTSKTGLVGGTIINGTLRLSGSNIQIENLGVDVGSTVCSAINSGVAMDGLVLNDSSRNPLHNCTVKEAVCIVKDASAPVHNFLFEGCVNSNFYDLTSYLGQWGTVLKTLNSSARTIKSYGCTQAGLAIKSDSGIYGTHCRKTSVSDVKIFADGQSCVAGILIYAATYTMDDICLDNFRVEGCLSNLKLACDSRAAYTNLLINSTINNGILVDGVQLGLDTFGAIMNVNISNVIIKNTVSGKSIKVDANSLGINLSNVTASSPSGINKIDNIYLAGRYTFDNLISCVSDDYSSPAGVTCVIESQVVSRIGSYIGNLAISGSYVDVTLSNGWSSYFSIVTAKAIDGRVQLFGRVNVPPNPWSGKALVGNIPASLAPKTAKYFTTIGYSSTNETYSIMLSVRPDGRILVDDINIPAAFNENIMWIGFDGTNWILAE